MSSSGTPHDTAAHRSGRCVSAAPTSNPPFERPSMARRSRDVRPGRHEPVGGRVEVVEHVLLVRPAAGVVPRLAVLDPAPQAGDRIQPAPFAPRGDRRRPHRRLGDREPAVAVEDRRRVGAGLDVGAMDEEHPDLGPVERRIGHLRDRQPRDLATRSARASACPCVSDSETEGATESGRLDRPDPERRVEPGRDAPVHVRSTRRPTSTRPTRRRARRVHAERPSRVRRATNVRPSRRRWT